MTEALYLAEICKKVTLVHRRDTFRSEDIWIDKAKETDNIEFVLNEEVDEIAGSMFMEKVRMSHSRCETRNFDKRSLCSLRCNYKLKQV